MKKLQKNKGITLIALIVTIIVLLILAGVTLNLVAGGDGILGRAETSTKEYRISAARELLDLKLVEIDSYSYEEYLRKATFVEIVEALRDATDFKIVGKSKPIALLKEGLELLDTEISSLEYILVSSLEYEDIKFKISNDREIELDDTNTESGITLSKSEIELIEGGTETITASLTAGITGTITWTSSDTNVVTVDNGKITAVGSGTAEITAKVEGTDYSAKCTVTIVSKVTAITVEDLEIKVGSSAQLVVTTTPAQGSNVEGLTYESSDTSIATVDENGNVTISSNAAEGSTAIITVTGKISKEKATCTVKAKTGNAEEIANNMINAIRKSSV